MPRGSKKIAATENPSSVVKAEAKARKPYPSKDERIAMADRQIARLTALVEQRKALVEKTESLLNQRRTALAGAEGQLEKVRRRKEWLLRPEARKTEKNKLDELMTALAASGKSVDDLLAELKAEG